MYSKTAMTCENNEVSIFPLCRYIVIVDSTIQDENAHNKCFISNQPYAGHVTTTSFVMCL